MKPTGGNWIGNCTQLHVCAGWSFVSLRKQKEKTTGIQSTCMPHWHVKVNSMGCRIMCLLPIKCISAKKEGVNIYVKQEYIISTTGCLSFCRTEQASKPHMACDWFSLCFPTFQATPKADAVILNTINKIQARPLRNRPGRKKWEHQLWLLRLHFHPVPFSQAVIFSPLTMWGMWVQTGRQRRVSLIKPESWGVVSPQPRTLTSGWKSKSASQLAHVLVIRCRTYLCQHKTPKRHC